MLKSLDKKLRLYVKIFILSTGRKEINFFKLKNESELSTVKKILTFNPWLCGDIFPYLSINLGQS